MSSVNQTLRASTLVETLVMMLVAGVVFLSVMDGLRLFTHLQTRRMAELAQAGRQAAGYYRIESLLAGADSIEGGVGRLGLYREGALSRLELTDSALIYRTQDFCDTLMTPIGALRLTDSVEIDMRGFTAKFAARTSGAQTYRNAVNQIEKDYDYEE